MTAVRGIRGATTVESDTESAVRAACCALFGAIVEQNQIPYEDLISVMVTVTPDLTCMFPATAIREECGLEDVPLIGAVEATIQGGLTQAIRVLVHINTEKPRSDIVHVFQGEAARLRPDLGAAAKGSEST